MRLHLLASAGQGIIHLDQLACGEPRSEKPLRQKRPSAAEGRLVVQTPPFKTSSLPVKTCQEYERGSRSATVVFLSSRFGISAAM